MARRAGAVGSIGESAPGKIATELLFSHRNDAELVLTGIAKAQLQHGTSMEQLRTNPTGSHQADTVMPS
jgi:hypothetical protein